MATTKNGVLKINFKSGTNNQDDYWSWIYGIFLDVVVQLDDLPFLQPSFLHVVVDVLMISESDR